MILENYKFPHFSCFSQYLDDLRKKFLSDNSWINANLDTMNKVWLFSYKFFELIHINSELLVIDYQNLSLKEGKEVTIIDKIEGVYQFFDCHQWLNPFKHIFKEEVLDKIDEQYNHGRELRLMNLQQNLENIQQMLSSKGGPGSAQLDGMLRIGLEETQRLITNLENHN